MIDTVMRVFRSAERMAPTADTPIVMAPSVGTAAAGPGFDPAPSETDFGTVFREVASAAYDTLRTAEATALAGVTGAASTQAVAETAMAAELTLGTVVAVRDKLVSAWQDLARMPI